uniref:RBPJ-interacting and tubulin-associated protein 1 n=1 Tax=Falco tinnunculus TaxID=100819 RepID=A0A8C4TXE6_FALTI
MGIPRCQGTAALHCRTGRQGTSAGDSRWHWGHQHWPTGTGDTRWHWAHWLWGQWHTGTSDNSTGDTGTWDQSLIAGTEAHRLGMLVRGIQAHTKDTGHRGHRHTGTGNTRPVAQLSVPPGAAGMPLPAPVTARLSLLAAPCRPRSHTPSFCDESLFGARAPRLREADVAKLHPLLWSPPPAPQSQPGLAARSRGTPLRAVHRPAPASPPTAGFETGPTGKSCGWKRPESNSCSAGRGAPGRGRAQSLCWLSTPSDGLHLASDNLKTEKCRKQSPATAPMTPPGPLMRGRSKSVSGPSLASSSKAAGGCKPRPPWK